MKQKLFNGAGLLGLVLVLILVAFNLGGFDPLVQQGTTHLTALTLEGELNAEQVTSTDDLTVTDDIAVGGDTTLSGLLYPSFADLAVSDGDTITPTYTTYALDTSGAVTVTLAAVGSEGQILILINDDANATIIADTNLRSSDGNAITLAGAHDLIILVYQDSEWLELAKTAGS